MTAQKNKFMNATFYNRLFVAVIISGLLAACSAASPDEDKKGRLEKLKTQQANLAKEIVKLEEEIAKENPDSTANVRSKEIAVAELSPRKFDHYVQTQGTVEAENNTLVSAKTPGVITQVFVNEGDQVSKGQTLAQIDNSVIERSIEELKTQLELATSVYDRQKNLWDQKIGTEVQYLQAKTTKEGLEKRLAATHEQNEMSRIKSPINGTVDEITVKVGENINPGMPAIRVVNTSDLKLKARVSEAFVTKIKKGNKVVVNVSELNRDIPATVTFVGRTIDPMSRTFDVEVKLPSEADLRPNMTATVRVVFHTEPLAVVVPVNVIQDINNQKVVYVSEAKGKQTVARRKVVTVEGVYGGQAQVKGLNPGDKLITVGYQGLNDGDFVKI
jgi:membrane fusion protein, multidrug efflux system